MYDIDYQTNKKLCVSLLKHDPRMISNMKNIDFELVKPLVDISLTYIHKINFRELSDVNDVYKIIEYAYRKSKMYKKTIMDFMFTNYAERGYYSSFYTIRNFDINNQNLKKLIKEIIIENPMYVIFIKDEYLTKLFNSIGLDYKEFVSGINFKKLIKEIEQAKKKVNSFNNLIDLISNKYILHSWYGKDYVVSEKTKDEKIEKMFEEFPNNNDLNSLLLLLKMS